MNPDDTTRATPSLRNAPLTLSRRGSWGHIIIAIVLITVMPLLIAGWLWRTHLEGLPLPASILVAAGLIMATLITAGCGLLFKYPISLRRLRQYLQTLSTGNVPLQVALTGEEDDLAAVQHYLEKVVKLAEERIHLLEEKHKADLDSERHRVMVESIGAMCHHLGQPATVLSLCLYRLKNNPPPSEMPEIMKELEDSFDAMTTILDQLRDIPRYASEPYLTRDNPGRTEQRILKL